MSRQGAGRLPPGPRTPRLHQTLGWWYRPLAFLEEARRRHGDRFTLRLIGIPPVVVVSGPEDVKAILTGDPDLLQPGKGAEVIKAVVGRRSLGLLDGDDHLAERRLMLPPLQGKRVEAMATTMRAATERALADWPAGEQLALHPPLQRLSLDIALQTLLGLDHRERSFVPLRDAIAEMLTWAARLPNLVPTTRRTVLGRGPWASFLAARERADRRLFALIEARAAAGDDHGDVLSSLLAARYEDGGSMGPRHIRDELVTLIAGGHETTALTLSWACSQLARNDDVRERLVAELDADAGEEYLTATVQETLRHRPVLPILPRRVARPTAIGGWLYPTGILLQADAYLLHHDPAVYPDPYAFRPERFLERSPETYRWIPFGSGRRRCIGAAFATLQIKTVLRVLLRERVLTAAGGSAAARRHNVALSPADGAQVALPVRSGPRNP
jgi:cytochrome P450